MADYAIPGVSNTPTFSMDDLSTYILGQAVVVPEAGNTPRQLWIARQNAPTEAPSAQSTQWTLWVQDGSDGSDSPAQTGAEIITAINGESSGTIDAARLTIPEDTTKLDASENIVSGTVSGTTLTLARQDGENAIEITGLPGGGQTTTIAATTDGTTITGDGTGASPLTVANPFTPADENLN